MGSGYHETTKNDGGKNQGVDSTAATTRGIQPNGESSMNNGASNAQAVDSKNTVPAQQAPNRVGPRPKRFFKPHVIQAKDRYYEEEERDKHWQRGRKRRQQRVRKVYKESLLWVEHRAIMEKAGVDMDAVDRKFRYLVRGLH